MDGLEVAVSMSLTGGLHTGISASALGTPEMTPEASPLRRTPSQIAQPELRGQWNEHAFHYRTDQFLQPEGDLPGMTSHRDAHAPADSNWGRVRQRVRNLGRC